MDVLTCVFWNVGQEEVQISPKLMVRGQEQIVAGGQA